jgi:hypothetical protein
MKKFFGLIIMMMLLCACGDTDDQIGEALALRQRILAGNGCKFSAEITADYGTELYQFTLSCEGGKQGNLRFSVVSPESISGVTGSISELGGVLTFDGTALGFPPIADGQLTPVIAPWVFLKTLRSGYIAACAKENERTYLQIDDSYSEKALHLDIWLNEDHMPVQAEILWEGRRILSITVREFTIL